MSLSATAPKSPAALFIALWRDAARWSGPERAGAHIPGVRFTDAARKALLRHHDAGEAYAALSGMIGHGTRNDADFRGQTLIAMQALDEAYYLIHPRGTLAPAASGLRSVLPHWLRNDRDRRQMQGRYAIDGDLILLPRGPLLRGARHPTASSADSLADRFAALAVAPVMLDQEGRGIRVEVKVVPPSVARGVPPGAAAGAETVAFIPIAEAADDIVTSARTAAGQVWVDFRLRASLNGPSCITAALAEAGGVDLAVAPEFMVDEANADALAEALTSSPAAARLVIAGSGATTSMQEAQAWNEARALNSSGVELWRQRKLWPAGIDAVRAGAFGAPAPPLGQLAYEDIAAGDRLTVVDAEGLGRCAILICQDLEAEGLAADLVRHYQPDWVFVPLLDSGVGEGRWMHRRAFDLSARAQCRFVLVSSTSLAAKAGYPNPACAMAVGPQVPAPDATGDDDLPRAFQTAEACSQGAARFAIIQWRHGRWLQTKLQAG